MKPDGQRAARRERMRQHLALRAKEGLTYKELSARTGVKVATLARWQRVFNADAGKPKVPGNHRPREKSSSPFVELVVATNPPASPIATPGHFELTAGRHTIKIPFDFDARALESLLNILYKAC